MKSRPKNLTDLPVQTLMHIVTYIPQQPRKLAELCTLCRLFRLVVTPLLYNKLVITIVSGCLDPILMACLLFDKNFGVQYIRHIEIRGHWAPALGYNLLHLKGKGIDTRDPSVINASLMLGILLERIPNQMLRTFQWDVTEDFPRLLMDKLMKLHPNIESLELWESGLLPNRKWIENIGFYNLKNLNMQNTSSWNYLNGVSNLVAKNWQSLKVLDLSCNDFQSIMLDYPGDSTVDSSKNSPQYTMITETVFNPKHAMNPPTPQLKLTKLILHKFPLTSTIFQAVDMSMLHRLCLHRCWTTSNFLAALSGIGHILNLKYFYLLVETGDKEVGTFLKSFNGLETLFLLVKGLKGRKHLGNIFNATLHHRRTLRRLVIDAKNEHNEPVYLTSQMLQRLSGVDLCELGLSIDQGTRNSGFVLYNILVRSTRTTTLQTIHIRNPVGVSAVGNSDFFQSDMFRSRRADAERLIGLNRPYETARQKSLQCIAFGEVETVDIYTPDADAHSTCFMVNYVDTGTTRDVPILSPILYRDLCALGTPHELFKAHW